MDELKVRVTGTTVGFEQALGRARAETKRFSNDVGESFSDMAKGFAVGFVSEEAVRQTLEFAGNVNDLSQRLGISTTAVQKWNYALKMSGSDMSALAPFFTRLAQAKDNAIEGDKKSIESFRQLGVSMDDLKSKRLEDIGAKIARTFQTGDSQKLIGAMADVGGRGAGAMVAAFKDGFDDLASEAESLGVIIDESVIKRLDAAGDRFASIAMQLRAGIAPVVAWLGDRVQEIVDLIALASAAIGDLYYGNTKQGEANATSRYVDSIIAREEKLKEPKKAIPEDDANDERAGKSRVKELAKARADLASEIYKGVSNQQKLNLLLADERKLVSEISAADKRNDEVASTKLRAELLKKMRERKDVTGDIKKDAEAEAKKNRPEELKTDSLSKMGLFTQSGLLFNPMLDLSRQQLQALQKIEMGIGKMASRPDPWS